MEHALANIQRTTMDDMECDALVPAQQHVAPLRSMDAVTFAMRQFEAQAREISNLQSHQEQMRQELHAFFRSQCLSSELNSQANALAEARFLQLMEACVGRMENVMSATASVCAEQHVQHLQLRMEKYFGELVEATNTEVISELRLTASSQATELATGAEMRLQAKLDSVLDDIQAQAKDQARITAEAEIKGHLADTYSQVETKLATMSGQTIKTLKDDLYKGLECYANDLIGEMKSKIGDSVRETLVASLRTDIEAAATQIRDTMDEKMQSMLTEAQSKHQVLFSSLETRAKATASNLENDLSKRVGEILWEATDWQQDAHRSMEKETRSKAALLERQLNDTIENARRKSHEKASTEMHGAVQKLLDDPRAFLDAELDKKILAAFASCEKQTLARTRAEVEDCLKRCDALRDQKASQPNDQTEPPTPIDNKKKDEPSGSVVRAEKECHCESCAINTGPIDHAHARQAVCLVPVALCTAVASRGVDAATQTDLVDEVDAEGQTRVEHEWKAAKKSRIKNADKFDDWFRDYEFSDAYEYDLYGISELELKTLLLKLEDAVGELAVADYVEMVLDELPDLLKSRLQVRLTCMPRITTRLQFVKLLMQEVSGSA